MGSFSSLNASRFLPSSRWSAGCSTGPVCAMTTGVGWRPWPDASAPRLNRPFEWTLSNLAEDRGETTDLSPPPPGFYKVLDRLEAMDKRINRSGH